MPNALREFERGRTLGGKPPAIVGFREHIFSDLGLLGELAASSELCFGTLVQRTLASPLQSRYHYGHPDMLDKIALIAQGGVSKATKDLNLSEDIFAGMDATLRGHTIVHREYFQVGKGRDTGCVTILQFFSKLSQGTAQMTTSRQALRLGLRLGLTRLMGFYYAHIGYYLGQLHFYHALCTQCWRWHSWAHWPRPRACCPRRAPPTPPRCLTSSPALSRCSSSASACFPSS